MPGLNGTGPLGQGPQTGRGRWVGRGLGLGRGVGRRGIGGVAACVCPSCGHSQPHVRGVPCVQVKCPKCGALMRGDYCMPVSFESTKKKQNE